MNIEQLIDQYKVYLLSNHSKITVKNYISDINHFIDWFANNYNRTFCADLLTLNVINAYKDNLHLLSTSTDHKYSYKSASRHVSSLRSFSSYLTVMELITENPFKVQAQNQITHDPWSLKGFKNFLYSQRSSDLTVKYYINDIQGFSKWYEESVEKLKTNDTPDLNAEIFLEYSRRLNTTMLLSPKTINRKLSSLRRYTAYLQSQNHLTEEIKVPIQSNSESTVSLNEITIQESVEQYSKIPPLRLAQRMAQPYLKFEEAAANAISSQVIKSKLRRAFEKSGTNKKQQIDNILQGLNNKNIKKEFYAPYSISTQEFSLRKKAYHHIKYTRPEWYKKYHTYPFVHYLHFGVLIIAAVSSAFYLYYNTIGNANATNLQTKNIMQKTFAFKGKLLDKNNTPITQVTDLRLGLYTNPTASGSALAWQEVQTGIKPDEDGNISIIIGNRNELPEPLINSNTPLYLGVTIGTDSELSPRQQIGTSFANTANNVQGLLPITNTNRQTNVLLALDASGVLSIGGNANPVFTASGGQFTLSGNTVLLTTNPGSNGNIIINPSENGKIDLQKPLINTQGEIIAEGGFIIHATTSAKSALTIQQYMGGPFITASTSGQTRFQVDSQGTITHGNWAGNPISPEFGGFGANITPATPGEILYSTSTKSYGHLRPGTAGQCLTTNGYAAPLWSSCGFLSQLNGALTLTNNTFDILLGGNTTDSAKFVFSSMSTGTPSLKIGKTLILGDNSIYTNGENLKLGTGETKNILLAQAGNVGINTLSPNRTIDVNGTWGGNVDFYSDGEGTRSITRDVKALIYDLEKSTGSYNLDSETTYNITALPNTEGTFAYIYTKVEKGTTVDPVTQTIVIKVNGVQVGLVSTIDTTNSYSSIKHYTLTRSNNTWHLLGDTGTNDTADLAEWTKYEGTKPISGNLVSIGARGKLVLSRIPYDSKIAGVVSTNPNITIGAQYKDTTPLALSGRIPAIVVTFGDQISSGDTITSSPIPGVGMKMKKSGATVGKALESFSISDSCKKVSSLENIKWPDDDGKNTSHPCFKVPVASFDSLTLTYLEQYGISQVDYLYIGKVMMLSNLSWSNNEDLIASVNSATIVDNTIPLSYIDPSLAATIETLNSSSPSVIISGETLQNAAAFSSAIAGKIKAGVVTARYIASENIAASYARISNLTVQNGITASTITSPLIEGDIVKTNSISPRNTKDIAIKLPNKNSKVSIQDQFGETVSEIDASGNASFSGGINSQTLSTNDATISGTLRAQNLIANNIEGLSDTVASITSRIVSNLKPVENSKLPYLSETLASSSVSAQFGTFYEGLLSLGASTFGNLSVMDQLSIGTTFIFSQNSINTLGTDLAIQPLRQGGVSFLAGAIRIETDGQLFVNENAIFNKNLSVKGKLMTNIISPLPDSDLSIQLSYGSQKDARLLVKNASNSAVLAVSSKGDIHASGSATISKLNFNIVGQALASDEYTASASSSAGTAIIKAGRNELTILNPLVTSDSLIYITPAQNTNNNVLYLMRQSAGESFTVGISQIVQSDTLFNWLIVN
ncbi:MAG: site-specific integrase [Candidatus Levybacteria bacterium]|nr:site-specific integrase [Candidatus Levybacteria bacterium]MBP9815221.1 site-specific integrase [Candidatus Levybacteria bacterium]